MPDDRGGKHFAARCDHQALATFQLAGHDDDLDRIPLRELWRALVPGALVHADCAGERLVAAEGDYGMKEFGEGFGIACIILALCGGLGFCSYIGETVEKMKVERKIIEQKIKKENP